MVFAYDWRDRIGDFCVADYLVEHYTVHVVKYSTRFSLHLSRTSYCLPTSVTTARERAPPPRQRVLQNNYAVIIRAISSQIVCIRSGTTTGLRPPLLGAESPLRALAREVLNLRLLRIHKTSEVNSSRKHRR